VLAYEISTDSILLESEEEKRGKFSVSKKQEGEKWKREIGLSKCVPNWENKDFQ
jgi:hypothetical protein